MLLTKVYRRKTQDDHVEEIIRNLTNILNTKKGFGAFQRTLGIGDYNAYRSRTKIVETILKEIRENIEMYEPRVKTVDIREVASDNSFRIRFELKCVIVDHQQPLYLIFDSIRHDISVEE